MNNSLNRIRVDGLDFDGVIVKSMRFYSETTDYLKKEWGIEFSPVEIVCQLKGLTFDECVPYFQARYKERHGEDLPKSFLEATKNHFKTVIASIKIEPISAMVEAVQKHLQQTDNGLFIASNSIRPRLNQKMDRVGLAPSFNGNALSRSDVHKPKPAADILLKGLESVQGILPENGCHTYTGDGLLDMQAGRAAGFKARIACFFEYPELADGLWTHFKDAGATHMVKSPTEWLTLVNDLS